MSEQMIVTEAVLADGQAYEREGTGQVHIANINGQQVQVIYFLIEIMYHNSYLQDDHVILAYMAPEPI